MSLVKTRTPDMPETPSNPTGAQQSPPDPPTRQVDTDYPFGKVPILNPLPLLPEQEGRCVACGFLASYDWSEPPAVRAIDTFTRSGSIRISGMPLWCFKGAADIQGQVIQATVGHGDAEERIREVIDRDRKCGGWFRYRSGFSPKEHAEQERDAMIEEARKAHDLQLAQMEADSRASAERIQQDSLEIAKAIRASSEAVARSSEAIDSTTKRSDAFQTRATRWAIRIAVVALVLAAAVAVFTALEFFHVQPNPPTSISSAAPSPTR